MYKVGLINMPFTSLDMPSLGLTQLKSVLDSQFGERISVQVYYLNHDLAHYLGDELYKYFTWVLESFTTGIGEWFFRQVAFPEAPDNTEAYFQRFYPRRDEPSQAFKRAIQAKRQGVGSFLDELIDKYGLDQADIVGFTSMFHQNVASLAMARKLKQRRPGLIIVMGGANCEVPMGDTLVKTMPQIDFAFSGPALKSFPEFVGYCLNQETDKCHRIDGVFSKHNRVVWPPGAPPNEAGAGEIPYVGPIGQELDMDTRIELDYGPFLDLVEANDPGSQMDKTLLFETSRGCWWGERVGCTFCGLNGIELRYRVMSPARALEQFESLFKYAPRHIRLRAVDNAMPRHYPQAVFAHLNTPPEIVIGYDTKVNVHEQDIRWLAQARVKGIQPGIEALNTASLKLMRKGADAFQNVLFLKYCVSYDISPKWSLLIGFPGEEEAVYEKYVHDIPHLMHLPPPAGVFPIRFDRYSHYFYNPDRYGLVLQPHDYYSFAYPFSQEVLEGLAYYFVDSQNFKADYFRRMLKWIGKLRDTWKVWWDRWHGGDSSVRPALFFKANGESGVVYDSRSGEVIEHPVGDAGRQILEYLARPRRIADLAGPLSHIPQLEQEITHLRKRGLIFEEGERGLSLVLPKEPAPLAFQPWSAIRQVGVPNLRPGGG